MSDQAKLFEIPDDEHDYTTEPTAKLVERLRIYSGCRLEKLESEICRRLDVAERQVGALRTLGERYEADTHPGMTMKAAADDIFAITGRGKS